MKINGQINLKLWLLSFDLEIANAKLLKVDQDYFFLNLTLYHTDSDKLDEVLGIDFGISEQLTLSSCLGFKYQIKESNKLKNFKGDQQESMEIKRKIINQRISIKP